MFNIFTRVFSWAITFPARLVSFKVGVLLFVLFSFFDLVITQGA